MDESLTLIERQFPNLSAYGKTTATAYFIRHLIHIDFDTQTSRRIYDKHVINELELR